MDTSSSDLDKLFEIFRKRTVLTRQEIIEYAGFSWDKAMKILKAQGEHLRSYNQNGKYYALLSSANFDKNGLCAHGNARFSKYGNIFDTIVALVNDSEKGLRHNELKKLLKVEVIPRLSHLYSVGRVSREKIGDSYVYVSVCGQNAKKQLKLRQKLYRQRIWHELPDEEVIMAVLRELLSDASSKAKNVSRRLSSRGVHVSHAEVQKIVEYYDFDMSKKNISECKS